MSSKILSFFLLVASLSGADRYQAAEPHMGTLVGITLYADSPEQAQQAFVATFDRIARLNAIFSDYDPNSELSKLCETGAAGPELTTVLAHAQALAEQTDGAFDITVGPLSRLWREARRQKRMPAADTIAEAMSRSGYRKLQGTKCSVPGMRLDAGGIAKGYAADEALAVSKKQGIRSALIAISGDVVVSDPPPGKPGWKVSAQGETLTLSNAAVSTSGDEFQFLEIDGVRYSHIFDPRTGMPLRDSPAVSVVAPTGIEADSLATTIAVLGASWPDHLRSHPGLRVITSR